MWSRKKKLGTAEIVSGHVAVIHIMLLKARAFKKREEKVSEKKMRIQYVYIHMPSKGEEKCDLWKMVVLRDFREQFANLNPRP